MTDFQWFKKVVKSKGGIWNTKDVCFAQFRDGYSASYLPNYPDHSPEDQALSYNWRSSQWRYISPEEYNSKE